MTRDALLGLALGSCFRSRSIPGSCCACAAN